MAHDGAMPHAWLSRYDQIYHGPSIWDADKKGTFMSILLEACC